MLQTLDFDVLKLDRTLLADIVTSEAAASIVETAVSLADRLGLEVVAKGIETTEQSEAAVAAGAQWLQGYHHHRPMTVDAFLAMVEDPGCVQPR